MNIYFFISTLFCVTIHFNEVAAQNWIIYNNDNSELPHNSVYDLNVSGTDKWIGTEDGLVLVDGNSMTVYDLASQTITQEGWILSIAIDEENGLWLGTGTGGLVHFDQENWYNYHFFNSDLPDNFVTTVAIDSENNKWIGTSEYGEEGGMALFDGSDWQVFKTDNSGLPNNNILTIVIDDNDEKWIGTEGGGLARYDGNDWFVYNTDNSDIPSNTVIDIYIDNTGNKWIGTAQGAVYYDGVSWEIYDTSNSQLPSNVIRGIAIDSNGDKWFATSNGVAQFNGTDWNIYNSSNSDLPDNMVMSIKIDANDNKWFGTLFGGVGVYGATVSVEEILVSNLNIYPNPTSDKVFIESNNSEISSIELFDMFGRKVLSEQIFSDVFEVNVSHLSTGTYICHLKDTEMNSIQIRKLIVQQ